MLLKMIKNISDKAVCVVLSLVVVLSVTLVPVFALSSQEKAEYNNKINAIKDQIEENKKKISEMDEKASSYDSEIEGYQDKIDVLQSQIDLFNQKISVIQADIDVVDGKIDSVNNEIDALKAQINDVDDQIADIQQDIADTYTLLGKRIRASYMCGANSALEYILTSDDFQYQSFLERVEFLKRIAENDDKLVKTLENNITSLNKKIEKIKELDKMKDELEGKKQEQVDARQVIQDDEDEIQGQLDKIMEIVDGYNKKSKEYQDAVERGESAIRDYEAELAARSRERGETGSGTTGDMIWPLPYGDTYISSLYGWRQLEGESSGRNHNGLDICRRGSGATYGSTVVAVKDGKVIEAVTDGYGGGFGLYVGISHGDGVETYYAHLSAVTVSVGDYVTQGSMIGRAGNSGYSFGAHLHYGVMVNGSWIDPLSCTARPAGCEVWEY